MPTYDEHEGFQLDIVMLLAGLVVWPTFFMNTPASEFFTSPYWFKSAAILFWFCVLGHTQYGFRYFYPYLEHIPTRSPPMKQHKGRTKDMTLTMYGGLNTWNYVNYLFFIQGVLSWQWSQTNGPVTIFDQVIFWSVFPFSVMCGRSFYQGGWYQPLIVLVMAPIFQLLGYLTAA